jgi:hypothetical protein
MHGPIGLLLFSLAQVGASADGAFDIVAQGRTQFNLLNAPSQRIRGLLQELATDARLEYASTQRSCLEGLGGMDREVFQCSISKRTGEERRQLHHLCTLSSWDNEKLYDAGQAESTTCDLCLEVKQTTDHLLYSCSALEPKRVEARKALGECDFADLPKPLLRGVPPTMSASYEGSFWGTAPQTLSNPANSIGCFNSGWRVHADVRTCIEAHRLENPAGSAKHIASKLKGGFGNDDSISCAWSECTAPYLPNVYSDGGLAHPTSKTWSVGSFGVFWPNRDTCVQPLTKVENDFAYSKIDNFSVSLWGPICGSGCSSTRAELYAGILALAGPGPVHLASDSSAFLKRARKLKGMVHRQTAVVKDPVWATYVDGDLWETFWRLMKQKGPNAIRFSKVKGHAGAKEIRTGTARLFDVVGNNKSDTLATKGRVDRSDKLGQLADFFATRQNAYVRFVIRLHNFQIAMLNAVAAARRAKKNIDVVPGFAKTIPKCTLITQLPYPGLSCAGTIVLAPLPEVVYSKLSAVHKHVLSFFVSTRWALADEMQQGASWIEILVLYFARGGSEASLGVGQVGEADSRISLRKLLPIFKKIARAVLSKYVVPESQVFFKPSKFAALRAKPLGFTNHIACIAGIPYLEGAQPQLVAKMLVTLRHTFTNASAELMSRGKLMLRWQKLLQRGAAPTEWSAPSTRKVFEPVPANLELAKRKVLSSGAGYSWSNQLYLKCPSCGRTKDCGASKLINDATWLPVSCKWCKLARSSAKWMCQCGVPWFVCDAHASIGHAAGTVRKRTTNNTKAIDVPMPLAPKRAREAWDHPNTHTPSIPRGSGAGPSSHVGRGQKRKLSKVQQRDEDLAAFERIRFLRRLDNSELDKIKPCVGPPVSVIPPSPATELRTSSSSNSSFGTKPKPKRVVVKPIGKFNIVRK